MRSFVLVAASAAFLLVGCPKGDEKPTPEAPAAAPATPEKAPVKAPEKAPAKAPEKAPAGSGSEAK